MLRLIAACTIFFSTFRKKIRYTFLRIIVHFWNIILRHSKVFDTKKNIYKFWQNGCNDISCSLSLSERNI